MLWGRCNADSPAKRAARSRPRPRRRTRHRERDRTRPRGGRTPCRTRRCSAAEDARRRARRHGGDLGRPGRARPLRALPRAPRFALALGGAARSAALRRTRPLGHLCGRLGLAKPEPRARRRPRRKMTEARSSRGAAQREDARVDAAEARVSRARVALSASLRDASLAGRETVERVAWAARPLLIGVGVLAG